MSFPPQKTKIILNTPTRQYAVEVFNTPAGIGINREILEGKTYPRVGFVKDIKVIVDIGANVGAASIFFGLHYPQARIFAFEPFEHAYELLCRNLANFANAEAFPFGLFDRDCRMPLFLSKSDSVTNSVGASNLNTDRSVDVEFRDARKVLRSKQVEQIDILKIDTEGSELPILHSIIDLLCKAKVIYLEYHDEQDRLAMDAILRKTHILIGAKVMHAHRGELCYVAYHSFPSPAALDQLRIRNVPHSSDFSMDQSVALEEVRRGECSSSAKRFQHSLGLLATVDHKLLLNREFLIAVIRAVGVRNYGPYDEYAESDGLLLQDTQQFADALIYLAKHRISSMVEIGSWHGYSACFITAFLRRFNPELQTTCVDTLKIERESFGLPVRWIVGTSDSLAGRRFDLTFIDGDHSFAWVKRDYDNLGTHSRVCMFHDIDNGDYDMYGPGVFWEQLKTIEKENEFVEYKFACKHFMGIGIRVKQS